MLALSLHHYIGKLKKFIKPSSSVICQGGRIVIVVRALTRLNAPYPVAQVQF